MKSIIDPDIEKLVQETVESGRYDSPKELVRDALLAFLKTDARFHARIRRLQKEIDLGLRDIERVRLPNWTPMRSSGRRARIVILGVMRCSFDRPEEEGIETRRNVSLVKTPRLAVSDGILGDRGLYLRQLELGNLDLPVWKHRANLQFPPQRM